MSKYILKLAGCFSARGPFPESFPAFWTEMKCTPKDLDIYYKYYYSEVVDFSLLKCRRFSHAFDALPMEIPFKGRILRATLSDISFIAMPYGVIVYYLSVEAVSDDLNDFTAIASVLRSPMYFAPDSPLRQYFRELLDLYNLVNDTHTDDINLLVEEGNKLKVFQIIDTPSAVLESFSDDELLYMLGTVSAVAPQRPGDPFCMSKEYIAETMKGAKLSVFANWSALALFDTFTMLAFDGSSRPEIWLDDYFAIIYLHSIYVKFFLQRLNRRFRLDKGSAGDIVETFEEFDVECCFGKISYNFLPNDVAEFIDRSLHIADEKELLHHVIQLEDSRRQKDSDRKLERSLTFLSILTVFSTIWDTACLINEIADYDSSVGSGKIGYSIVSGGMALIILTVVWLIFRGRKIRRNGGQHS